VGTKVQTESADATGGREFTQHQRQARQRQVTQRRRFRRWARRDRELYEALEHARTFGSPAAVTKAHRAWAEHQLTMPVKGRMS
jgi:predicted TIM-barrel fold metal-dependent hydrolase